MIPASFKTIRGTARPYSNVSIPERKTLLDAGYKFAVLDSKVGEEVLAGLPVPTPEEEDEEVSGNGIPGNRYRRLVRRGLNYFSRQCSRQQRAIIAMLDAIKAGKLQAAKRIYARARSPYEHIEVLAPDFPDQDANIDGRPYIHDTGELSDDWRGMHEVERALFRDADLAVAQSATERVITNIDALCAVIDDGIAGGGSFSAENSFIGMIALAYEIPSKKISSEEETWSDLSLMIFRENVKGIWSQFRPFRDVLDFPVFKEVEDAYLAIRMLIKDSLDASNDFDNGFKFRPYSQVSIAERPMIHDSFMTLARALVKAHKSLIP